MKTRSMISFDWAMKRLLRNKANFEVLEGFLSELLRRKIIIKSIGESEGNRTGNEDKTNRVDILVEADDSELVIIELQYDSVDEYFHRMLYGVSKSITDYMATGAPYSTVRKVYSVNIVYFELGTGDDYVYHGVTNFRGLHTNSELQLTEAQQMIYKKSFVGDIYPEYYIIKVNGFNGVAKDTLDEWIYYLKNNIIEDHFTAQGLAKAKILLQFDKLSEAEKKQYLREIDDKLHVTGAFRTARFEGELKGLKKGEVLGLKKGEVIGLKKGEVLGLKKGEVIGLKKGEAKGAKQEREKAVVNAHKADCSIELISLITGLTSEQITEILQRNGVLLN